MKRFLIAVTLMCAASSTSQAQKNTAPEKATVKWKFQAKGPVFSSPVISDNVAYFGGLDSTVYAVDTNTGTAKWTLKTNGEIRSTPLVFNNSVYLLGGNGVFSCIDKNTGKIQWRKIFNLNAIYMAERRYDFADYYHSSPVLYNGVIYFGSSDGYLRALNAQDGEQLWSFKAGGIIHTAPVMYKDKVYFGSHDGYVYALNIHTGNEVWKFKSVGHYIFPVGEMQGSLAVSKDGLVHAGGRDYNLYSLDPNNGYSHWMKSYHSWSFSTAVRDSVLYVGTSDDHLLIAYHATTGQELWKTNLKFNMFGNSTVAADRVYVGTIWGRLYGLDRKTGEVKWYFSTEGHQKFHDSYFKGDDNYRDDIGSILRANVQWIAAEYRMGGIFSAPAVTNDLVVITTAEGTVYGLKR